MKHGKRPTRRQKLMIREAGLVPENWLIVKNLPDVLHLVNRVSGKPRKLHV